MKSEKRNPYGQTASQQKRIKNIFKQGVLNKKLDRKMKNQSNTDEYLRGLQRSETPQEKVDKQVKKIHNILNKVERTILK